MCACQLDRMKERKARFDATRPTACQRGYNGTWAQARKLFLKANPMCARPGCKHPATVVDHIQAHKGNMKLFWNRANWQSLCAHHHNAWKQSQEKRP
jgi:5-methylcytosine-specific restriction enzyme A